WLEIRAWFGSVLTNLVPLSAMFLAGEHFAFADGVLLSHFRVPSGLTRFFVVFMLAQLLGETTSLQELLESSQSNADRLALVDLHSQRHGFSLTPGIQ